MSNTFWSWSCWSFSLLWVNYDVLFFCQCEPFPSDNQLGYSSTYNPKTCPSFILTCPPSTLSNDRLNVYFDTVVTVLIQMHLLPPLCRVFPCIAPFSHPPLLHSGSKFPSCCLSLGCIRWQLTCGNFPVVNDKKCANYLSGCFAANQTLTSCESVSLHGRASLCICTYARFYVCRHQRRLGNCKMSYSVLQTLIMWNLLKKLFCHFLLVLAQD